MNLLILSLAPVFIIAGYIYFRDKYEREPIGLLLLSLFFGALTVVPVLFLEGFLRVLVVCFQDWAKQPGMLLWLPLFQKNFSNT